MPIAMSKDEWGRILNWTDPNRKDADARKREYVKRMNETSRNMTKSWPNSVENVNKRNEELRQARVAAAESANARFYQKYVKNKKEEQRKMMASARDTVFKNRDGPKLLLSAVIETVVQRERELQLKFDGERKKEQAEQKRRDDDDIIAKAKEWHELYALKKKRRFEVNKQHQKEIVEQAMEVAEKSRKEYETELNFQKKDNELSKEQMAALKKFDEEFRESEKARIFRDMNRSRSQVEARERERAAVDKMDDRLINVLVRARARTDARRKQTERQIREEKQRILDAISSKLESGDAARDEKERKILEKAIDEKLRAEDQRRANDKARQLRNRQERIQLHEQSLEDQRRREHEYNTIKQWECMNRFKNAELNEQFKEKLREEKERKTAEYREDIIKLWKEREDREARELAELRYFYGTLAESKLRDADNKLLAHGRALLDEARENGRPDFPLQRAIDYYCKLNRLYPLPPLPAPLQNNAPHYTPCDPPAPVVGTPIPKHYLPQDGQKKDGLQAIEKVKPAAEKPREENVADYKRVGKANGLQRKASVTALPTLTVIPCKTADCGCFLKQ